MPRIIQYVGARIVEDNLIIGNHSNAQVIVKGDFLINGLIYCPGYRVDLIIRGNGTISLHGVCRQLNIVKVKGNCVLEFESLLISDLNCRELTGNSVLKIGKVRTIGDKNLGTSDFYREGRKMNTKSSHDQFAFSLIK